MHDASVGFEVGPVWIEEAHRIVFAVGSQDNILFAPGKREIHDDEHGDGGFGQLTAPGKHLEPFIVCNDPPDSLFLEVGKFIFGIIREKELDPFYGMFLKIFPVFFPFGCRHVPVDRCSPCDVFFILLPIEESESVSLFHCLSLYNLSLMYASASRVISFAFSRSAARTQSMSPVKTLMMSQCLLPAPCCVWPPTVSRGCQPPWMRGTVPPRAVRRWPCLFRPPAGRG